MTPAVASDHLSSAIRSCSEMMQRLRREKDASLQVELDTLAAMKGRLEMRVRMRRAR